MGGQFMLHNRHLYIWPFDQQEIFLNLFFQTWLPIGNFA